LYIESLDHSSFMAAFAATLRPRALAETGANDGGEVGISLRWTSTFLQEITDVHLVREWIEAGEKVYPS